MSDEQQRGSRWQGSHGGRPRSGGPANGRDARGSGERRDSFRLSPEVLGAILARDGEKMVQVAKDLARNVAVVKAAQLRNFYGTLLKLEARAADMDPKSLATEFHLLRPKLRYMASREPAASPLNDAFDSLLAEAARRMSGQTQEEACQTARCVFEFAEAVVAYHHDGRRHG